MEAHPGCKHHPESEATQQCADCGVPLCELCIRDDFGRGICPSCHAKLQRPMVGRPGRISSAVNTAAFLLVVATILFVGQNDILASIGQNVVQLATHRNIVINN